MSNFNEDALFDNDVSGAVSQLLNQYQNGGLSKDEYPLALLNLYGMMLVSQLKRQAEGLVHIFEVLNQIEMNTRK